MTAEEFDQLYQDTLQKMEAYAQTQQTEDQQANARHQIHHLKINHDFFKHGLVELGRKYHLCNVCGMIELCSYTEPTKTQLQETGLCFHCNHWNQIAAVMKPHYLIVKGCLYRDGGNKPNERRDFLGFGGHVWKIKHSDGRTWETNNLWHDGTIPHEYRTQLPDNAEFLP